MSERVFEPESEPVCAVEEVRVRAGGEVALLPYAGHSSEVSPWAEWAVNLPRPAWVAELEFLDTLDDTTVNEYPLNGPPMLPYARRTDPREVSLAWAVWAGGLPHPAWAVEAPPPDNNTVQEWLWHDNGWILVGPVGIAMMGSPPPLTSTHAQALPVAVHLKAVLGGQQPVMPELWRDPRLHLEPCEVLDQWIHIPVLGCSDSASILLRRAEHGREERDVPLCMEGLDIEVWFYSHSLQTRIQLRELDILKECPAKHLWPWCTYCQRFLFPAEEHRGGCAHKKCTDYLEFKGRNFFCAPSNSTALMSYLQGSHMKDLRMAYTR